MAHKPIQFILQSALSIPGSTPHSLPLKNCLIYYALPWEFQSPEQTLLKLTSSKLVRLANTFSHTFPVVPPCRSLPAYAYEGQEGSYMSIILQNMKKTNVQEIILIVELIGSGIEWSRRAPSYGSQHCISCTFIMTNSALLTLGWPGQLARHLILYSNS